MNSERKNDNDLSGYWTMKVDRGASFFNYGALASQNAEKQRDGYHKVAANTIYEFVSFQKLLNKIVRRAHPLVGDKVEITVSISQSCMFHGDLTNIERTLQHLVFWVAKSLDPNKHGPFIYIEATVQEGQAIIEIVDNGKGLIPNYPVVNNGQQNNEVLGYVLAGVKLISGYFNVSSSPFVGTHIYLRIPASENV